MHPRERIRPRSPAPHPRAENDHVRACWIRDGFQRLHEALSVGVLPGEATVANDHGVDRTGDRRARSELIKVLQDRLLMGNRAVEAEPPHADRTPDGIREMRRRHLAVEVADVHSCVGVRGFHDGYGRVLRRRRGERSRQIT